MRRFARVAVPFALIVLLPSAAFAGDLGVCASSTSGTGILTGLAQQFQTATAPWTTTALAYARGVFFALVGVEIAWSGITYVLQKDNLSDFLTALLLKLLSVGLFFILLQPEYGPVWINDVVASFMQAGSAIGGQSVFGPTDPSAVFNCGTDIAGAMFKSLDLGDAGMAGFSGGFFASIEAYITVFFCSLGVVLGFAVVAGQLMMTLIESYIVIGGGIFMLGFTGSRWTLVFGEKYIGYVFSVGIKLFMLELIVGLGYNLGRQWAALFYDSIAPPGTYIEVVGAVLIFGFVAWQIPGLASSLMNGTPRMTLGSYLSGLGTLVVSGVVIGSGAVGLASAAAGVVSKGLAALRDAAEVGGATGAGSQLTARSGPRDDAAGSASRMRTPGPNGASFTKDDDVLDAVYHENDASEKDANAERSSSEEHDAPHDDAQGGRASNSGTTKTGSPGSGDAGSHPHDDDGDASVSTSGNGPQPKDPSSGGGSSRARGNPLQGFRIPPVPNDAAEGGIHINFKHPE
jgi:type IV secretion system protein TrbL